MNWRYPAILSLIAGLAVALALPTGLQGSGPTGRTIVAYMGPPTLSSGSVAWLNCGWHAACGATPTAGTALDWDDENTGYNNTVYFRGWFARTNTDTPTTALDGQPVVNRADPNFCDIRDVWIIERHNGELRAVPRYLHVTFTNSSRFGIAVSTWSQYNNRAMMATIDDTGTNCTFGGSHAHEDHVDVSADVTETRNTGLYPGITGPGACTTPHCRSFRNNVIDSWIRKFQWAEGS